MKTTLQIFFLAIFVLAVSAEGQTTLQTIAAGLVAIISLLMAVAVTKLPNRSQNEETNP